MRKTCVEETNHRNSARNKSIFFLLDKTAQTPSNMDMIEKLKFVIELGKKYQNTHLGIKLEKISLTISTFTHTVIR